MSESKDPDPGFTGAPFGVAVPWTYRKRPEEALTAQAYFFLFWWYRLRLVLFIVGTLLLLCAVVIAFAGAADAAGVLGVVAVTIQVVGGFGWAVARMDAPKGNMALYVDADGTAQ